MNIAQTDNRAGNLLDESAYIYIHRRGKNERAYTVRFDGGELITHLFTGELYLKDGVQPVFGSHHVSLYLPAKTEWDAWYNAELSITNAGAVSPQTLRLFGLRE